MIDIGRGGAAGMAFAIIALVGMTAEAQRPNLSDIALCNEQAQAKAGPPSASPPLPGRDRERAPGTVTPRPGTRTDPSGSIIVQSPDPLLEGMAAEGLDDPAYRTAYRDCMAGRLPARR
jgi:hypothetical protein